MTWENTERHTRKVQNGRGVHNLNIPPKIFDLICNPASDDNWIQYVVMRNPKTGNRFVALCDADGFRNLLDTVNDNGSEWK